MKKQRIVITFGDGEKHKVNAVNFRTMAESFGAKDGDSFEAQVAILRKADPAIASIRKEAIPR